MNTRPIFIKNARIVCGGQKKTVNGSLLITFENGFGVISGIGELQAPSGCRSFDADGSYIFPSFVDIGCRLYDKAEPAREGAASGPAAAVGGGYSHILCEPDESLMPYAPTGQERCRMIPAVYPRAPEDVARSGKGIYSDGGKWIADSYLMREIMTAIKSADDSLFISSATEPRLARDGVMNASRTAKLLGLCAIPKSAETVAVMRDILLSYETGCRLHIRAVSLSESVKMIREAKKSGVRVSCGTSPLYFALTDSDMLYYGASAKVMPPLRSADDVQAIREGLLDGTVDCISSLHTPLTRSENCSDLNKCKFGASGLDTAFSAYVTYMLKNGYGSVRDIARLFSVAPAELLGFDSTLSVGKSADITVASLDSETVISSSSMKSKAVNTPFFGSTLSGSTEAVFLCGIKL